MLELDTAPLRVEQRGGLGLLTLDAPKSLNALSLETIRALDAALRRWADDPQVACVLLQSSSDKAFCAGGDVRGLREACLADKGPAPNASALQFFGEEYRLDHRIHTYAKPIVVWGGGIVMGGGVGLLAGASHRVVSETSRIAMPEVGIGLFPDVGGSWFLRRMPGRVGLFLGLTGAAMNAHDALFTGLADHFMHQASREPLIAALSALRWSADAIENHALADEALRPFEADAEPLLPPSPVRTHYDTLQALTAAPRLRDVVAAITGYDGDSAWLQRTAQSLAAGSPTSVALVGELWQLTRHLSLADVFRLELIVALQCCARGDFAEGVRALLVDKDGRPQWSPRAFDEVTPAWIDAHFAALWTTHPLADL